MRFLCTLTTLLLLILFTMPTLAQDIEPRETLKIVGYYYVDPDDVAQDSTNASIILTIKKGRTHLVSEYEEGLQVVFKTEQLNGNNGNITIAIRDTDTTTLEVKQLRARDGQQFGIGELDANIMITGTYDGTHFISDFSRPRQFRYIEPTVISVGAGGNAYAITDTSIPPIDSASLVLGIKAKANNTGNVTLSVNSSLAFPVFLSNGAQIPAGALEEGEFIFCILTNVGGIGFRATNLHPARSLKGQLLATLEIPAGTYTSSGGLLTGWVLEAGVTEIEIIDFPGGGFYGAMVTDGMIAFPLEQFSESQLGWFIEVDNGTIPVFTELKLFGYSSSSFALEIVGTDDPAVQFTMRWPAANTFTGVDRIGLTLNPFSSFTLATPYTFNLYVTEN